MTRSSSWARALTAGAVAWLAMLFLAPLALSHGGGTVARASLIVYEAAGRVCHQRPERSFHIAGVQQPVCARCASLYMSGALAALAALIARRRRNVGDTRLIFVLAAIPTAVTVGLEFVGLAHLSNIVRSISALPLGAVAGWVFVGMLDAPVTAAPPR